MIPLALAASGLALAGLAQAASGASLTGRFARRAKTALPVPADLPPVTILKPLYGDEPGLEAALASYCAQDYPCFQVVFGVSSPQDAALPVARRLQARFPRHDIAIVCETRWHGINGKVSNLINMLPQARHDLLLIADSDMQARPDFLRRAVAALATPGTGLVTTLYSGLPASASLAGQLAATQINATFLPGALLARSLGRQDCLGATMLLPRSVLERIGGFAALVDHLADDNILGQLVLAQGLKVELAATVPATIVAETALAPLWRHELRWARTIRRLVPVAFALSCLQYPLFWALVALLADPSRITLALFALAWIWRAAAALYISRVLRPLQGALASPPALWLLPLRDLFSIAVMVASHAGSRVEWRGHAMQAGTFSPEVS